MPAKAGYSAAAQDFFRKYKISPPDKILTPEGRPAKVARFKYVKAGRKLRKRLPEMGK